MVLFNLKSLKMALFINGVKFSTRNARFMPLFARCWQSDGYAKLMLGIACAAVFLRLLLYPFCVLLASD